MSAVILVNQYLDAFYSGDFAKARELVSDDFQFKVPFAEATNKQAYFSSAALLAVIAKGHRLVRQWADGDEVWSIHDVDLETPAGKGSVTMCEWHKAESGKLVFGRMILDTAAFRAVVPAR